MHRLLSAIVLLFLLSHPSWADNHGLLGSLEGASFNTTADQAISIRSTRYVVRRIVVTGCSANLTLAAGGFYTGAGKTGTTVVAAAQVYTALSSAAKALDVTLAAGAIGSNLTATTLFLALTTAQGSAATCDVYVFGDALP